MSRIVDCPNPACDAVVHANSKPFVSTKPHCWSHSCPWLRCTICGAVTDLRGHWIPAGRL